VTEREGDFQKKRGLSGVFNWWSSFLNLGLLGNCVWLGAIAMCRVWCGGCVRFTSVVLVFLRQVFVAERGPCPGRPLGGEGTLEMCQSAAFCVTKCGALVGCITSLGVHGCSRFKKIRLTWLGCGGKEIDTRRGRRGERWTFRLEIVSVSLQGTTNATVERKGNLKKEPARLSIH